MMKYTGGVSLMLGLVFAVPALTFDEGLPDQLELSLQQTLQSLKVLGELEKELDAGRKLPADLLPLVTEAPIGDEAYRSDIQNQLRAEVSALETKRMLSDRPAVNLDGSVDLDELALALPERQKGESLTDYVRALSPSTGLDEMDRNLIAEGVFDGISLSKSGPLGKPSETKPTQPGLNGSPFKPAIGSGARPSIQKPGTTSDGQATEAPQTTETKPGEPNGYSADPLRQAQACYRAGRYSQGSKILATVEQTPTVKYWRARLYVKSNRISEAITLFQEVEADDQAGNLATQAKREREFAEWRLDFEERTGIEAVGTTDKSPKTDDASDDPAEPVTDAGEGAL